MRVREADQDIFGNIGISQIYSALKLLSESESVIISEMDGISRFSSKEKLASYAGLVQRQDQYGSHDKKGYITKKGS